MSKVCAAKQMFKVSVLAPIISSPAAKAAATTKLTPAYANNTVDNVVQYTKIESPQMNTVYAVKSVVDRTWAS